MFQFISSKLAGFISVLLAFASTLSAHIFNSSENQSMEFIAHKQVGSGKEKILVMHSWTGDATSYDSMLPYLNTDDYTYVFVDLRGYGGSKEMQGTFSVEEASADAIKLIDFLGWDAFHLIGHSMSGMIVQKIAVDHPYRVKSVVAITPVPACGSPGSKEIQDFFKGIAISNDEAAMGFVNTLTSNRYTKVFAKKMITEIRQHSTSGARLGYMNMFFHTDFSESVKGLSTPILVLFGEYDSERLGEALMRSTFLKWYPNAHLECCKGSGHYPMIETPVALVTAIEKFLSVHSSALSNGKISEFELSPKL
jgi:pimeloyl-ACP methyl ester carboxylesterase